MKVICAGFSRTGTKSISEAFRILGYQNVHDMYEHVVINGEYWKKIFSGNGTYQDFRDMYEGVDTAADMPVFVYWEEILKVFPDAKVVLTVRESEDEWYASFRDHFRHIGENLFFERHRIIGTMILNMTPSGRKYLDFAEHSCKTTLGFYPSWKNCNEIILRNCYRKHNRNVISGCPKDRLLIFNVKEGWTPLCSFLGQNIPDCPFPHINQKSQSFILQFNQGVYQYDSGLYRRMKSEAIIRCLILISLVILIIIVVSLCAVYIRFD